MNVDRELEIAAEELALAGRRAGLQVCDLLMLLESGTTIEQLVHYLAEKLSGGHTEN